MWKKVISIILINIMLLSSSAYSSQTCPKRAKKFIPTIKQIVDRYWKSLCPIEIIPAQIQKESNWNVYAERKAGREYGFGLSQTTIVKGRFNNFLYFKKRWKRELAGWTWKDRFNPTYHIKVIVLYDKSLYDKMTFAGSRWDRLAFTLSAYNGGIGNLLKERRIAKRKGLNPNLWFDNVEKVSVRNKWSFKVNRTYVKKIMLDYAPRYKPCFSKPFKKNLEQ